MLTLPRLCVGRVKLSVMRAHTHTPQAHSSTRHLFPLTVSAHSRLLMLHKFCIIIKMVKPFVVYLYGLSVSVCWVCCRNITLLVSVLTAGLWQS